MDGVEMQRGAPRRVTRRIIPFVFVPCTLAFLGRLDGGVAAIRMDLEVYLERLVLGCVVRRVPSTGGDGSRSAVEGGG